MNKTGMAVFPWKDCVELTKPRLSILTTMSAVAGYLAAASPIQFPDMMWLTIGTFLAAGGSLSLNQVQEQSSDKVMERTKYRPLPDGKISTNQALSFGMIISCAGVLLLFLTMGIWPATLALVTLLLYNLIYTPLKQRTHWCTLVGAVPGAIPPLIGWTAATGKPDAGGWILFALLAAWQMPHFFSIASLYKEDYETAGLKMLTVVDPSGIRAGRQSLLFASILSLLPLVAWSFTLITPVWALVLTTCSGPFLLQAYRFYKNPLDRKCARLLFFGSLIILPILLTLFVFAFRISL